MRIKKPQTIQMMVGSCVHSVLADNFAYKALIGDDLPVDEVIDKFAALFDLRVMENEVVIPEGKPPSTFKDSTIPVVRKYMDTCAASMFPKVVDLLPMIEVELRRPILGVPDFDFLGYLDLVTTDNVLVDYKITSKKWSPSNISEKVKQAIAYGYLLDVTDKLSAEFHVCVRDASKPVVQIVPTTVTTGLIELYEHRLIEVIQGMKDTASGAIQPTTKDGYCNENLCQHYWECRDWQYGQLDMEIDPKWASIEEDEVD